MLVFVEGGKLEKLEKKPWSGDENQQQSQPTYDNGSRNPTQVTLVVLSPLCYPPSPDSDQASENVELLVQQENLTCPI